MTVERNQDSKVNCREARKQFSVLARGGFRLTDEDGQGTPVENHIRSCSKCLDEYQLLALELTVVDLFGAAVTFQPEESFYYAVQNRIRREEYKASLPSMDPWPTLLWGSAKQLIPAVSMLLLLIIGATLFWRTSSSNGNDQATNIEWSNLIAGEQYELSQPSLYDVAGTTAEKEENGNGR